MHAQFNKSQAAYSQNIKRIYFLMKFRLSLHEFNTHNHVEIIQISFYIKSKLQCKFDFFHQIQFLRNSPSSRYAYLIQIIYFFLSITPMQHILGKNINCKIGKILDSEFGFYIELEEGGTFCSIV